MLTPNCYYRSFIWKATLVAAALFCLSLNTPAEQIPQFRGNLQNTGVFDGPAPRYGRIKWKFRTGGIVVSSPVVYERIVYFGGSDAFFYAVDVKTGELIWKYRTEDKIWAGSAVYGGGVYFGGTDRYFYGLDRITGKPFIKSKAFDQFYASPAIFEDKIFIGCGSSFIRPAESIFYILDLDRKRNHSVKIETSGTIKKSAAIWSDYVYFKSRDHHLYKINFRTRKGVCVFSLKNQYGYGSISIGNGLVYAADDDGSLFALNLENCLLKWGFKANDRIDTTPAVTTDMVYFGSNDTILYALDAKTGEKKWRFKSAMPIRSSPVIAENTLFFAGDDGLVHALDRHTGVEKWQVKLGGITRCDSPFIAEGMLFVGNNDCFLYAID